MPLSRNDIRKVIEEARFVHEQLLDKLNHIEATKTTPAEREAWLEEQERLLQREIDGLYSWALKNHGFDLLKEEWLSPAYKSAASRDDRAAIAEAYAIFSVNRDLLCGLCVTWEEATDHGEDAIDVTFRDYLECSRDYSVLGLVKYGWQQWISQDWKERSLYLMAGWVRLYSETDIDNLLGSLAVLMTGKYFGPRCREIKNKQVKFPSRLSLPHHLDTLLGKIDYRNHQLSATEEERLRKHDRDNKQPQRQRVEIDERMVAEQLSLDTQVETMDTARRLRTLMKTTLTPRSLAIFMAYAVNEEPAEEVGARYGITASTVRSLATRIKKQISELCRASGEF